MNCPTCGHALPNHDKLLIDMMSCRVSYGGHVVKLTPQQTDILKMLHDAGPAGITQEAMLRGLNGWNPDCPTGATGLRTQKSSMKKRLLGTGLEIVPTYARGYRLVMG